MEGVAINVKGSNTSYSLNHKLLLQEKMKTVDEVVSAVSETIILRDGGLIAEW